MWFPTCERKEFNVYGRWQKDLMSSWPYKTFPSCNDLEIKVFLGTRILAKHKGNPTKRCATHPLLGSQHMSLRSPSMLQSNCVYAGRADPGGQTTMCNSPWKFCAQLYSRKYYGILFATEGSSTEPAPKSFLLSTQAAAASLTFSRSAQLPKSCSER